MGLKYSFSDKILSSAEMKKLETDVCAHTGKSIDDLMEAAGSQVSAFIESRYQALQTEASKILILAGPGNNGGDGLVTGRLLAERGYNVQIVLLAASKYSVGLQRQLELCQNQKIQILYLIEHEIAQSGYISLTQLSEMILQSKLVVDCLLGSGQRGDPRGLVASTCLALLDAKEKFPHIDIISVDVPTGIDCESGYVGDPHVSPNTTIVIQHLKLGMVQLPALYNLGELVVVDAGIHCDEVNQVGRYTLAGESLDLLAFGARKRDAHKGNFGHLLILAGSPEMPGAAHLCALAALRTGTGLLSMLSFGPDANYLPEAIQIRPEAGLNSTLAQKIVARSKDFSGLLLGPGLGKGEAITSFVYEILREVQSKNIPCVIDADGLNALAELQKLGVPLKLPSAIFTPHPGEAARLLQISTQEVQSNRYLAVEKIASTFGATVVLKGASSICYDGKLGTVNSTGGPFLATAGSGDVLAGMIAALMGSESLFKNGYSKLAAASLGVFLHGICGELAVHVHNGPIIARDIIEKIPYAVGRHVSASS